MNSGDDRNKCGVTNYVTIKKMIVYGLTPPVTPLANPVSGMSSVIVDNESFEIDKVLIPDWVVPVKHPESPEGGIPIRIISTGLLSLKVLPWLGQDNGETVSVLLNESDVPVTSKPITVKDTVLDMEMPGGLLRNGINRLRLRVKRTSGNMETSQPRVVLFNFPRPGGDVTGPGDNPYLLMTLPADVIANGVDAARAAQGVEVELRYNYMREHDVIILDCDGHEVPHTVTAAQATARIVVLKLFADAFQKGDNPRFAMRFRVRDQIGNDSGPLAIWSKTTYIDVHIQKPVLDLKPPKVLEALELSGTRLNFVRDFYEAKFATVEVAFTGSAPGQTVKVYWLGRNSTYGSEIQTVSFAGQTLRFPVPRLEVVDCIGSGARVWYTVRLPNTTQDLPSRDLNITVTPQSLSLAEPTLNGNKSILRTPYPSPIDKYTVRMAFFGVNTHYGQEVQITSPTEYTEHPVPRAWLDENRGKTVMFNFTLRKTGAGEPIIFSWCLRLIA
ncbi:hypothetical protein PMI30_03590 [Pseudomonas sp. GM50]|uniref:hypothetical protein n=1 Tax=Pseudomonas sp. GM50 TaxID=1144332 RepID=UPI000270B836|nr:hypothetical protein [Pseudomonas sp. GM50]EJM64655.1 hypothetical protein PMI30_03590 [Pseudomonas sp. GM50]